MKDPFKKFKKSMKKAGRSIEKEVKKDVKAVTKEAEKGAKTVTKAASEVEKLVDTVLKNIEPFIDTGNGVIAIGDVRHILSIGKDMQITFTDDTYLLVKDITSINAVKEHLRNWLRVMAILNAVKL